MLAGADGEPEVACIVVAALFVGNSVIVVVLKLYSCNACCFHTVCLQINGRSGFSKQTNNNTLYHRCTQLGNFPRPNYVMKYSNRDLLA